MATISIGKAVHLDDAARERLRGVLSSPQVWTTTLDGPVAYASDSSHHDHAVPFSGVTQSPTDRHGH